MLSTQELASEIKLYYAPEWDREVIVEFIRKAQLRLCLLDSRVMVFWNRSDPLFPIPFLETTAGQLSYEVGNNGSGATGLLDSDGNEVLLELTREGTAYPVMARRIRNLFRERTRWAGPTAAIPVTDQWFYDARQMAPDRFTSMEFVPDDMEGTDNAKVTFLEDPGTTTNVYFCSFYFTPIDLLSDAVPLTIDGDQWRQELIDGSVGYIEDIENGDSKRLARFEKDGTKKFINHNAELTRHYRPQKMRRRLAG